MNRGEENRRKIEVPVCQRKFLENTDRIRFRLIIVFPINESMEKPEDVNRKDGKSLTR